MTDNGMVLIVGVGPGMGTAQARRFAAGGHPVAVVARKPDFVEPLADEINSAGGTASAFITDAGDQTALEKLFDQAEEALGPVEAVIVNAGGSVSGSILDLDPADFEACWRGACLMAFLVGQTAARRMVTRGSGSILYTGNQTSREGVPNRVAYSVAKSGVRILAQSMARDLGPRGIHVAHIQLDGGVDNPRTRKRDPDKVDNDGLISTDAAAEVFFQTHHQPRSCWSFDVEARPWNKAF